MNDRLPGPLISRGRAAQVYAWREGQVLKLFRADYPPEGVCYEVAAGQLASQAQLPTPRLLDTVEIDGRQGIIYERVAGPTMLEVIQAKPWLLARLGRQLAELHITLHRVEGTGLHPVREMLRRAIERVAHLPPSLKDAALEVLASQLAGRTLCHFDFHPDQVLMAADGPVVIDWANACQGAPLADVARTTILLSIGEAPDTTWWQRIAFTPIRSILVRSYLNRYLELQLPDTREQLRDWLIPVAAARLDERIPHEERRLLRLMRGCLRQRVA